MSNEHIARLQKIGFGKEAVSGTAVAAAKWIPKAKGLLVPKTEYKYDEGAYGNIDKNREAYITRQWTELTITDTEPRDKWIGDFMMAAFGLEYPCVKFPIPGSITGTFSEGETVTETDTVAKGVIRRADAGGSSKALYVEPTTVGVFTVTIASPGVFSLTGHGFSAGDGVAFTTTGALPTGIVANTNYFVIAGGLTADAFEVSATSGGAAINTTGSQSGVHTAYRGYFAGAKALTGGTSGATATAGAVEAPSAVRYHVYRRLNSNTHPSYTLYGQDPETGDERAAYCMLDNLDFECKADDIIKFSAKFMGQAVASTSTQTPLYTSENPFLGKYISAKIASVFTSLDAATAVSLERVKVSITKKVEAVYQTSGTTPTAPTSLHNTEFEVKGDFTMIYNSTTNRTAALAGTAKALRLTIANTGVTIGSAANPTLQLDLPEVYFNQWGKTDDNGKIVREAVSFTAVYNAALRGFTAEGLVINTQVTAY